jgi:hypothetical protein
MEWNAVRQNTILSLHSVNFLPAAMLARYSLLEEADHRLVRRIRLRDDGLLFALSRCFLWDERVTPDQFAHDCGISQAWQGGSWANYNVPPQGPGIHFVG